MSSVKNLHRFGNVRRDAFAFLCMHYLLLVAPLVTESVMTPCPPLSNPCVFKQTSRGLYADCSKRGLAATPCELPKTVASLRLDINNFTTLDSNSFNGLQNIKVLTLVKNFLAHIADGTFDEMPHLTEIILSKNKLTTLPEDIFLKNSVLKRIVLPFNKFQFVPIGAFKYLKCGEEVILVKNFMINIHFSGVSSINLTKLNLGDNAISRIVESDFSALSSSIIDDLQLFKNTFSDLPDFVFRHLKMVRKLNLEQNNLEVFNLSIIAGMTSLEVLSLRSSKIKIIRGFPMGLLNKSQDIPKLIELYLFYNNLITLTPNVFRGLKHLTNLNLAVCGIRFFNNDSFYGLFSLETLNLNQNLLQEVNAEIFSHLPRLHTLRMSKNKFTVLSPLQFKGINSLKILDFSHNKIQGLYDERGTWHLPSLVTLDISNNDILSLQAGLFRGLSSLRYLKMSFNPITSWGRLALSGLDNLTKLDMSNVNRKNGMVYPFKSVKRLKILRMSHTRPGRINRMFFGLSLLETLELKYSQIQGTETFRRPVSTFTSLLNLKILLLEGNSLDDMLPGTFDGLWKLKKLDLNTCNIRLLPNQIFRNLTSLTSLNLGHNKIETFSAEHLQDLHFLRYLILSDNHLGVFLERNLFINFQNAFDFVSFANNRIGGFEDDMYLPIRVLDVSVNPLACTCDLQWFQRYVDMGNISMKDPDKTICSAKSIVQFVDKPFRDFQPDLVCGPFIGAYIIGSLAAVFCLVALLVAYRNRWLLNYACFHIKLVVIGYDELQDDRERLDYDYDVNVIFPDFDEEWVRGEFMAAFGEHLPDFPRERVICGEDDLPLGGRRLDVIDSVIENSFKTFVIVSNAAVHDAHFMTQLQMAVEHMNEVELEKVVLVFKEDVPDDQLPYLARLFLSRNKPYLQWSEDRYGRILFWEKLAKNLRFNKKMNSILPL